MKIRYVVAPLVSLIALNVAIWSENYALALFFSGTSLVALGLYGRCAKKD